MKEKLKKVGFSQSRREQGKKEQTIRRREGGGNEEKVKQKKMSRMERKFSLGLWTCSDFE